MILLAKRIIEVPETKHIFQIRGIIGGVEKDNFYKEVKTKNGSIMRCVNFFVDTNSDERVYISLTGFPRDKVYFYKKGEDGAPGTTKEVAWADRYDFKSEGYNMFGVKLGLTKEADKDGKLKNVNETHTEYDSCAIIAEKLKDGMSVFIKGNIIYSSKTNSNGEKARYINLSPNQISLCKDEIDFHDETFKRVSDWEGVIVYDSVEPIKNDNGITERFSVSAKIVKYDSVEDVEFYIDKAHEKLATTFKKNLKPFTAISVSGDIRCSTPTEDIKQADDEDQWGDASGFSKAVTGSHKVEYFINGATPSTIDKETFSKGEIEKAIKAIKNSEKATTNYADKDNDDDWGDVDDSDETPWD